MPLLQNKLGSVFFFIFCCCYLYCVVFSYCVVETVYVKLMQYMWIGQPHFAPTEFYAEVSRFANWFTDNR